VLLANYNFLYHEYTEQQLCSILFTHSQPFNELHVSYPYVHKQIYAILECGQMLNVMVALPNTGGALRSTPQSLADAHYWSAVQ